MLLLQLKMSYLLLVPTHRPHQRLYLPLCDPVQAGNNHFISFSSSLRKCVLFIFYRKTPFVPLVPLHSAAVEKNTGNVKTRIEAYFLHLGQDNFSLRLT